MAQETEKKNKENQETKRWLLEKINKIELEICLATLIRKKLKTQIKTSLQFYQTLKGKQWNNITFKFVPLNLATWMKRINLLKETDSQILLKMKQIS